MIIILIIFLTLIYILIGLLPLVQIILWLLVFFASNFILGIHPEQKHFHVARITAIIAITFIIYYYSGKSIITSSIIIPLSIDKITYLDNIGRPVLIDPIFQTRKFQLDNLNEISEFIKNLEDDTLMFLEFIPEINSDIDNAPQMLLSNPIMINKHSSTTTIIKFINERLMFMVDHFYLDDLIIQTGFHKPGIIIKYHKVNM